MKVKVSINNKPVKVLLIEDDNISQKVQSYMLSILGCEVDHAENGEIALRKLDDSYDLVFVDVRLPDLSGFDLVEIIRTKKNIPHIPIILLTSHEIEEIKQQFLVADVQATITKPATKAQFKNILQKYVHHF